MTDTNTIDTALDLVRNDEKLAQAVVALNGKLTQIASLHTVLDGLQVEIDDKRRQHVMAKRELDEVTKTLPSLLVSLGMPGDLVWTSGTFAPRTL